MRELFEFFVGIASLLIDYLTNFFISIVDVIILVTTGVSSTILLTGLVPPFLGVFILFVVILGALKLFFALGGNQ